MHQMVSLGECVRRAGGGGAPHTPGLFQPLPLLPLPMVPSLCLQSGAAALRLCFHTGLPQLVGKAEMRRAEKPNRGFLLLELSVALKSPWKTLIDSLSNYRLVFVFFHSNKQPLLFFLFM